MKKLFEKTDFQSLFKLFKDKKILVIGDVMVDTYLWGNVGKESHGAAVPVISGVIEENRLGGAANVAVNVKAMGAVPILCSVIGEDEHGSLFLDLMEEQALCDVGLVMDEHRVTTRKTRIMGGDEHLLRLDEGMDVFLSGRTESRFIELIRDLLESGGIDAMIFQDADKGVLSPGVISEISMAAAAEEVPVLVDPKTRNFKNYRKVQLFKPNYVELAEGLNLDDKKRDIRKLAASIMEFQKEQEIDTLLLTMRERGIMSARDGSYVHLPAMVRKVADVSGAGDTVISVAALCMVAGLKAPETAAISNLAGGQVCEKSGVVPVDSEKLLHECIQYFKNP